MADKFPKKIKGIMIDPLIFNFKFECNCSGECCHYGVYTDLKEHDQIISIKDKIISAMDETQPIDISKWFEPKEKDEDFESGVAVGTEVYNSKCVFLDKNGLCTLQKIANMENKHKWTYKPLYCVLFPLTIFEGALTVDDEHIDRLKTCNKNPLNNITIFEACTEELIHLFGEDGFKELEEYRLEYLSGPGEQKKEVA